MTTFFVQMTDTFAGEVNYSWVHRFRVSASSFRGAITKVTRETGYHARKEWDYGDMILYKASSACICYFVEQWDDDRHSQYSNVKTL